MKKVFILFALLSLILCGCGGRKEISEAERKAKGMIKYKESWLAPSEVEVLKKNDEITEKLLNNRDKNYLKLIEGQLNMIAEMCDLLIKILDLYSKTWGEAIESGNDFNIAISNEIERLFENKILPKLALYDEQIEYTMAKMKKPPKDYEKVYDVLLEIYLDYKFLYSQAFMPSGTLVSFNSKVTEAGDGIRKNIEKMMVLLPEE